MLEGSTLLTSMSPVLKTELANKYLVLIKYLLNETINKGILSHKSYCVDILF